MELDLTFLLAFITADAISLTMSTVTIAVMQWILYSNKMRIKALEERLQEEIGRSRTQTLQDIRDDPLSLEIRAAFEAQKADDVIEVEAVAEVAEVAE